MPQIFLEKWKQVEKLLILTYMCIVYNVQLVFYLKSIRRVTFKLGSDSKSVGRTELHLEKLRNLPHWRSSHHHHVVSPPNHCSMLLFLWLSLRWGTETLVACSQPSGCTVLLWQVPDVCGILESSAALLWPSSFFSQFTWKPVESCLLPNLFMPVVLFPLRTCS